MSVMRLGNGSPGASGLDETVHVPEISYHGHGHGHGHGIFILATHPEGI
jgi:hypothetical protein